MKIGRRLQDRASTSFYSMLTHDPIWGFYLSHISHVSSSISLHLWNVCHNFLLLWSVYLHQAYTPPESRPASGKIKKQPGEIKASDFFNSISRQIAPITYMVNERKRDHGQINIQGFFLGCFLLFSSFPYSETSYSISVHTIGPRTSYRLYKLLVLLYRTLHLVYPLISFVHSSPLFSESSLESSHNS